MFLANDTTFIFIQKLEFIFWQSRPNGVVAHYGLNQSTFVEIKPQLDQDVEDVVETQSLQCDLIKENVALIFV